MCSACRHSCCRERNFVTVAGPGAFRRSPAPPYAVTRTSTMKARDYSLVESLIAKHPKLRSDIPTTQFVSRTLDLFPEQIPVDLNGNVARRPAGIRRAYLVSGANLFGHSAILGRFIKACIRRDPDALLQFVLCPQDEEPLDLLEDLIAIIRNCPKHLLDRYSSVSMNDKIASRRLMVQLPASRSVSRNWIEAAESLLIKAFF